MRTYPIETRMIRVPSLSIKIMKIEDFSLAYKISVMEFFLNTGRYMTLENNPIWEIPE